MNLLIGENGIFAKANVAKEETNKKTATEKINLKITNLQVNNYAEKQQMPTLQDLADNFCEDNEIQYVDLASQKVGSLNKIEVGNNNSIFTKLKEYPYEFEINSKLQLASINGVKIADNSNSSEEIESLKATISELDNRIKVLENNSNTYANKNEFENLEDRVQAVENTAQTSITTVEITLPSKVGEYQKVCDYPNGYTMNNTIINGYCKYDSNTYTLLPSAYSTVFFYFNEKSDGIYMNITNSDFVNKTGKLFLQKVN